MNEPLRSIKGYLESHAEHGENCRSAPCKVLRRLPLRYLRQAQDRLRPLPGVAGMNQLHVEVERIDDCGQTFYAGELEIDEANERRELEGFDFACCRCGDGEPHPADLHTGTIGTLQDPKRALFNARK